MIRKKEYSYKRTKAISDKNNQSKKKRYVRNQNIYGPSVSVSNRNRNIDISDQLELFKYPFKKL